MGFFVQDDTGSVVGANAYASAADFRTYHGDRGTDVTSHTDDAIQKAIVKATDYMDGRWRFRGDKLRLEQRTAWPRSLPEDDDQFFRTGIPVEVKEACFEYALIALSGELNPTPTRDAAGQGIQSKSSTVGPISESVTYVGGGSYQFPKYPKADRKLKGLVEQSGRFERG